MGAGLYDAAFGTLGRYYGKGARSAITSVGLDHTPEGRDYPLVSCPGRPRPAMPLRASLGAGPRYSRGEAKLSPQALEMPTMPQH